MEQLTIGLAIAALILSVVAIAFEVFFYRWQTQQGQSITDRVTGFAEKMHELLGELRGLSTQSLETSSKQFQTVLDYVVTGQAEVEADVRAETQPPVSAILERIGHIEEMVEQSPQSERLQQELSEVRSSIGALQSMIPEVVARGLRSVSEGGLQAGKEFSVRETLRHLKAHAIVRLTDEEAEEAFREKYGHSLEPFVSSGLVSSRKDGSAVWLEVTEEGTKYVSKYI